jgi:hypothetical protein
MAPQPRIIGYSKKSHSPSFSRSALQKPGELARPFRKSYQLMNWSLEAIRFAKMAIIKIKMPKK